MYENLDSAVKIRNDIYIFFPFALTNLCPFANNIHTWLEFHLTGTYGEKNLSPSLFPLCNVTMTLNIKVTKRISKCEGKLSPCTL